jgi:topoisomerase IA-like protein
MNRTAARILCERGRTAWPAGALLAEARKKAAKQDAKARKAASKKAAKAEADRRRKPAFI